MECNILYSLDLLNSWINGNVLKHTSKATHYTILEHTEREGERKTHTHTHSNTQLKDNMAIKTIDWCRQYQTGEFHFAVRITSICVKRLNETGKERMACHHFTLDTYMSPFCTLECYNSTSIDYNISKLSVIALISRAFRLI